MPGDLCVGMGGLGKITLVGGAYESLELSERFEKCVFATITPHQSCIGRVVLYRHIMGSGSKIMVFMMQHRRQNKTTRGWKKQKQ